MFLILKIQRYLRISASLTIKKIVRIKLFLWKKTDDIFHIVDQIKVWKVPLKILAFFYFWRNISVTTAIILIVSLQDGTIYLWCWVLSQRHNPKGDFPSDKFPSGNFPSVQFPKRQLPKG